MWDAACTRLLPASVVARCAAVLAYAVWPTTAVAAVAHLCMLCMQALLLRIAGLQCELPEGRRG